MAMRVRRDICSTIFSTTDQVVYREAKKDDSDSCSEDVRTSTARSESGHVDRKTEQPTGTILNRHLRWKGEEESNPGACITVQRLRREVDDHLDRWRYGGN